MARLPYAANVLIGQVRVLRGGTGAQPWGEPDGLGVYRTVVFDDVDTGAWLHDLLHEFDDDRIAGMDMDDDGRLLVHFDTRPSADGKATFPLREAEQVTQVREQAEPVDGDDDEDVRYVDRAGNEQHLSSGNPDRE